MDDGTDFKNLVAASDRLKARWHATVDHVTVEARALFGVELTPADIVGIPSARLAVLTDDPLADTWKDEAKQIPAIQKAAANRELKRALESGQVDAHVELSKLPRDQRISRARALGIESKAATATNPADHAALLRRCLSLPAAARVAFARTHKLI